MQLFSIDLFSGCGGLTEGLRQAAFETELAFEIDEIASQAYAINHPQTTVITKDIRKVRIAEVEKMLEGKTIHLLAGCPPCQGFSSIRRLNRDSIVRDNRNSLISQYVRFVKALRPYTFMMENVPALEEYHLFKKAVKALKEIGYQVDHKIVNVRDYGVPQGRRRLVLVGSRLGEIKVAESHAVERHTVRDAIGSLPLPERASDPLHKIFPKHSKRVQDRIELTPIDGGSRNDLPDEYRLECHKKENIGFNDVYGRLRWDYVSTTITGGCLNPSKGRFLHPEQNRCISAREAMLLQSFPIDYKLPPDVSRTKIALMIGNALPPLFSYCQALNIKEHLLNYLG
jgi:DNA (cytosine-5)-methyltransferase 1